MANHWHYTWWHLGCKVWSFRNEPEQQETGKTHYKFLSAVITKYHKAIYSLSLQFWDLEVQNQGVSRAMLPLETLEKSFLTSSQLLVVYWQFLVCLVSSCVTPVLALVITWHFPYVSLISLDCLLIRIPLRLDQEPPLFQYDLILTNYICNDPNSRWGHILRY